MLKQISEPKYWSLFELGSLVTTDESSQRREEEGNIPRSLVRLTVNALWG